MTDAQLIERALRVTALVVGEDNEDDQTKIRRGK